jgi:hypothetical protein
MAIINLAANDLLINLARGKRKNMQTGQKKCMDNSRIVHAFFKFSCAAFV